MRKYLIPSEKNGYKPHILRERAVVGFLVVVLMLFVVTVAHSTIFPALVRNTKLGAAIYASILVDLTNASRGANAASTLRVNPVLVEAARLKAQDMATKGYFAHMSPEGKDPWYWFEKAGYVYQYAGENLAVDFSNSEDVEKAWMNSPGHRANIVDRKFTEIGIATAQGMFQGRPTTFVVQMFGTPRAKAATVVSKNIPSRPTVMPQSVQVSSNAKVKGEAVQKIPGDPFPVVGSHGLSAATFRTNIERLLLDPSQILFYGYVFLGMIIALALLLLIFVRMHIQHPKNIAYGVLLLISIAVFGYLSSLLWMSSVHVI